MPARGKLRRVMLAIACVALCALTLSAQESTNREAVHHEFVSLRDGQHDFDFEIGSWKTHLRRLAAPLSGSSKWIECDGATEVRKIWEGRANLVELHAHCPSGDFEGLSLRLYHPLSHQWTLNFANSSDGALAQPTIGEFRNGRGEFFDQESFKGRTILVRFVITPLARDSCRFEQAFSDDGGKNWEVNWIAVDTRIKDE